MATAKLNNGLKMPMIGLGTWQSKPGQVEAAVVSAIKAGYRHIDCAFIYGNEKEIGTGLQEVFTKGIVRREDLFIVSKLWNTKHNPSDVRPALLESLSRLNLSYLDLYLIHWPICFKAGDEVFPKDDQGNLIYDDVHYLKTWKELESCVDEGLIKGIGLSNFNSEQIRHIFEHSRIKPSVLQVEVNPYFQQEKLVKFSQEHGLAVTAFSSFGSPERPWASPSDPQLLQDPGLVAIAEKYKKSPAQVILRWLIQRNIIVIPKSITPSRIEENFKIFDFELSPQDMDAFRSLDINYRAMVPMAERNGKREFRDKDAAYFPFLIDF